MYSGVENIVHNLPEGGPAEGLVGSTQILTEGNSSGKKGNADTWGIPKGDALSIAPGKSARRGPRTGSTAVPTLCRVLYRNRERWTVRRGAGASTYGSRPNRNQDGTSGRVIFHDAGLGK